MSTAKVGYYLWFTAVKTSVQIQLAQNTVHEDGGEEWEGVREGGRAMWPSACGQWFCISQADSSIGSKCLTSFPNLARVIQLAAGTCQTMTTWQPLVRSVQ